MVARKDGTPGSVAAACECGIEERAEKVIERARIPKRYEHCDFESFATDLTDGKTWSTQHEQSLKQAKLLTQGFVRDYPATEKGLLLMGPSGVGKTHLAVAALKELVRRGHGGLFCDYRELLKEIQHSYNPQVASTELEILRPVFDAEVLVLDELGASKPTEWVWDTVAHILNTRYNDKRTTIITTNYPDAPPGGVATAPQRAMRDETLGDRIGERMRSRLAEMCVTLQMNGSDFRQGVGRARFG